MNPRSLMGALLLALVGGCAGTSDALRVAQMDLGCDQVQVTKAGRNRYAATGCGRSGVYAELCSGGSCSWVRLRGPEEANTSGGALPPAPPPYEDVIVAPPPAQREIIPAPPPAQREIIPAPPPSSQLDAPALGADAQAVNAGASPSNPEPTPLDEGQLSDPYQTEVPVQPTAQRVDYPPPTPLVEQQPPPPDPSYAWIGGYWWWGNIGWTWVPGYWSAPRPGYRYIPGSWYWSSGYWWYGPGGWALPGSTIVLYQAGPRPNRTAMVRSFTPYRVVSAGTPGHHVGPAYAPAPARVGVMSAPPGHGPAPMSAPAQRTYTPSGSPMYQYPSATSRPAPGRVGATAAPAPSPGSGGWGGGARPASVPQSAGGSYPADRYRGAVFTRMPQPSSSPAPAPAPRVEPRPSVGAMPAAPAPHPAPTRMPTVSRMPGPAPTQNAPTRMPAPVRR